MSVIRLYNGNTLTNLSHFISTDVLLSPIYEFLCFGFLWVRNE